LRLYADAADAAGRSKSRRRIYREAAATGGEGAPDGPSVERFRLLMLPHLDAAYTLARYLTRNAAEAEDLVHDAYVRALKSFLGYRGGDAKAWLLAIVRNRCMTYAKDRGAKGRLNGDASTEEVEAIPEEKESPEGVLARRQDAAAVRRLVMELPPHLAEVLVLREVEDLSYREIATVIGAPIGTVMSRLARAREALGQAWREKVREAPPLASRR
jgi:RNA polymerase sigma-70 factor (ECF subfamily)